MKKLIITATLLLFGALGQAQSSPTTLVELARSTYFQVMGSTRLAMPTRLGFKPSNKLGFERFAVMIFLYKASLLGLEPSKIMTELESSKIMTELENRSKTILSSEPKTVLEKLGLESKSKSDSVDGKMWEIFHNNMDLFTAFAKLRHKNFTASNGGTTTTSDEKTTVSANEETTTTSDEETTVSANEETTTTSDERTTVSANEGTTTTDEGTTTTSDEETTVSANEETTTTSDEGTAEQPNSSELVEVNKDGVLPTSEANIAQANTGELVEVNKDGVLPTSEANIARANTGELAEVSESSSSSEESDVSANKESSASTGKENNGDLVLASGENGSPPDAEGSPSASEENGSPTSEESDVSTSEENIFPASFVADIWVKAGVLPRTWYSERFYSPSDRPPPALWDSPENSYFYAITGLSDFNTKFIELHLPTYTAALIAANEDGKTADLLVTGTNDLAKEKAVRSNKDDKKKFDDKLLGIIYDNIRLFE